MLPLTATYGVAPEDAVAVAVVLALSETGPGVLLGALCAVRPPTRRLGGREVLGRRREPTNRGMFPEIAGVDALATTPRRTGRPPVQGE